MLQIAVTRATRNTSDTFINGKFELILPHADLVKNTRYVLSVHLMDTAGNTIGRNIELIIRPGTAEREPVKVLDEEDIRMYQLPAIVDGAHMRISFDIELPVSAKSNRPCVFSATSARVNEENTGIAAKEIS